MFIFVLIIYVTIIILHIAIGYIWWRLHPKTFWIFHILWILSSILFGEPLGYHILRLGPTRRDTLPPGKWTSHRRLCVSTTGREIDNDCSADKQYTWWIDMSRTFLWRVDFFPVVTFDSLSAALEYANSKKPWPWERFDYEIWQGLVGPRIY